MQETTSRSSSLSHGIHVHPYPYVYPLRIEVPMLHLIDSQQNKCDPLSHGKPSQDEGVPTTPTINYETNICKHIIIVHKQSLSMEKHNERLI
jgi:hypothetical protein